MLLFVVIYKHNMQWIEIKHFFSSVQVTAKATAITMEVLNFSKFALRLANLSNKQQFKWFKWQIPNSLIDFVFLLPMSICLLQMVSFCCRTGNSIKSISSAIYLVLGIASVCAMYVCLAINNNLIIDTLDHLQLVINRSKCFDWLGRRIRNFNVKLVGVFTIFKGWINRP